MSTNWFGWDYEESADDQPRPWTLADIYDDLVSLEDLMREMNWARGRVVAWIHRRERLGCPLPIKRFCRTDVYSLQEWKDWYARFTAGKKPGTKWTDGGVPYKPRPKPDVIYVPRRIIRDEGDA